MVTFLVLQMILAVAVLAYFRPLTGAWTFIGVFVILFEGWLFFLTRLPWGRRLRPNEPPWMFTEAEFQIIRKYGVLFRYPYFARDAYNALSFVLVASIAFALWTAFHGYWWHAAVIAINFFWSSHVALCVDPRYIHTRNAEGTGERSELARQELAIIQSAYEKLMTRS